MIISNKYKYVYLACPKTGSGTTTNLLRSYFGGKYLYNVGNHAREIPQKYEGLFIFSTVRNPYPRMVSLWWQDTAGDAQKITKDKDTQVWEKNKLFGISFYDWLEHIQIKKRQKFSSQTKFFELVKLNQVVHLENFNEEFVQLPFVNKLPKFEIIDHAGSSSATGDYGDYREYYRDSKVLERMNDLCCEDFSEFGYTMGTL